MSESENEPVGEEVGILIGWIMVMSIHTEPEEVTHMEFAECGCNFTILCRNPCPLDTLCEISFYLKKVNTFLCLILTV
jgi:hypothetical protein